MDLSHKRPAKATIARIGLLIARLVAVARAMFWGSVVVVVVLVFFLKVLQTAILGGMIILIMVIVISYDYTYTYTYTYTYIYIIITTIIIIIIII